MPVEGTLHEAWSAGFETLAYGVVEGVFVDRLVAFDPCVEGVQDYGVGEGGVGGGVVGYAVEEVVGFECVECVGGGGLEDVGFEPAERIGGVGAQLTLFASETEIGL